MLVKAKELKVGGYYYSDRKGYTKCLMKIASVKSYGTPEPSACVTFEDDGTPYRYYGFQEGNWSELDRKEATEEQIRYLDRCIEAAGIVPREEIPKTTDNYLILD
jgi:hypothetical protein